MLFVELDQREMHSDLTQPKNFSVRENSGFVLEKKCLANNLCDQFFKTLTSQKQSKFIKDFKEMRSLALEGLVKALSSINKNGRFNNFNLRFMHVPLNINLETSFLSSSIAESYLKEVIRDTMWANLTGKGPSKRGEQDDTAQHAEGEFETFERLYECMEATLKEKTCLKERMIRPFNRMYQNNLIRVNAQKDLIVSLISKKATLQESPDVIEEALSQLALTNSQDPNSENADIPDLMEKMNAARTAFFDRKKIRAFEMFLTGA